MLTLPIKKKWYDMILSGDKKEEYREIKPYYTSRFKNLMKRGSAWTPVRTVRFRNGYSKNSPTLVASITISEGYGLERWGAKRGERYYILTIRNVRREGADDEGN